MDCCDLVGLVIIVRLTPVVHATLPHTPFLSPGVLDPTHPVLSVDDLDYLVLVPRTHGTYYFWVYLYGFVQGGDGGLLSFFSGRRVSVCLI